MAFVSYDPREDMQEDTFKIISQLVVNCIIAQFNKDNEALYNCLDIIRRTTHARLSKEENERIKILLNDAADALYGSNNYNDTAELQSVILDKLKEAYEVLTGSLTKEGIIFRMRSDLDSLVTQGGA